MKTIVLFVLMVNLALCSCYSFEEKATVSFESDVEIYLEIYDPIDELPNMRFITKKIYLKPNVLVVHEIVVDNFAYVDFKIPSVMNVNYPLLLLEGNVLQVKYVDGKIKLTGTNAEGIEYLYNNYSVKGLGFHHANLEPLIGKSITDKIDFNCVDSNITDWLANREYKKDLLTLVRNKKISAQFNEVLSKTLIICDLNILVTNYKWIMQGQTKGYNPSNEEKEILFEYIDQIWSSSVMLDEEAPKHLFYYPINYYSLKYRRLDEKSRRNLSGIYSPSIFGDFISLMLAPDHIQLSGLGREAIFYFQTGVGPFDNEKLVHWFQENFSDKEYTAVLSKLLDEQTAKISKKTNAVFIDRGSINEFKDLRNVKELKGKYIYIDLWASWCSPCLAQFKYNRLVHEFFQEKHLDVVTVYVSIDEDENDATWKRQIDFHKLNGIHLRASKSFIEYLSRTLYKGDPISVPRYLLLNKEGDILNDNLPRPSLQETFKEALNNVLH